MARLTKRLVDAVGKVEKDTVLWDSDLKGFGLRVRPSGRKTFILQYRNKHNRTRKMSLGVYGRITTDQARKMALQALARVDQGADPAEEKYLARSAPTVQVLAERYLSEHAEPKKKPASVKKDRLLLTKYILPALGVHKVGAVTRSQVADLHHSMRDTPYQANRMLEVLRKMFNLAEMWGLRENGYNPCRHIARFAERKRERFLSADELARLGQTLMEVEKEATELPSSIAAIRLLILTGCRRSEILGLKWEYVDFDNYCLRLPDSKTGAKVVPLSSPAIEVLNKVPRLASNPYVCPGIKPGRQLVGLPRAWRRIRLRAGLEDLRLHDLRHSFASIGAAAGLGLPIIGALLGHTQAQTTKRYAHLALDPLLAATEEVGKRIEKAMNVESDKKVLELVKKP